MLTNMTDRQRRKNENLAKEIFGNRRASAPGGMNKRNNKPVAVPSLASRIGPIGGGVVKVESDRKYSARAYV